MLEEEYAPFQKKYNLPKFSDIENEFDLLQADPEYPLKGVRKSMQDKLDFLLELLTNMIQPVPESLAQMHECEYLSEAEKKVLMDVFKEINFLLRAIHESYIDNDEKRTAEVIKQVAIFWPQVKSNVLPFVKKLKESWKSEFIDEEKVGYFG